MTLFVWTLIALVLSALSLAPSFAHLLEAPPRLTAWPPELWRDATVFHGQFKLFGILGGPIDIGVVVATAILAFLLQGDRPAFWFALAGALLFAISLAVWLSVVAPANGVMSTWKPGPIPESFYEIRRRWETGHIVMAALKLCAFVAVASAALLSRAPPPTPS